MKSTNLEIYDVIMIEPSKHLDERGFFMESYNQNAFDNIVGKNITFVQDNISFSKKGVLRGIHLQSHPFSQGKLVRVEEGKIFDVAIDLRKGSKTYLKWVGEILTEENLRQLWIPEGFGHAFLTLSKSAKVCYKTTNFYNKDSEKTILFNDPKLKINWEQFDLDIIISDKDREGLHLDKILDTL